MERRISLFGVAAVIVVTGIGATTSHVLVRQVEQPLTDRVLVEPFAGLPPMGAAPSRPEPGELVVSFTGRVRSIGGGLHRMWAYADGRLIWKSSVEGNTAPWMFSFGASEPTSAVVEQLLTPVAVERLRSDVLAMRSADPIARRPGVQWGELQIRISGEMVDVGWRDPGLPGRLADPASWLPAFSWTDPRIGAFVPSRYGMCVRRDAREQTLNVLPDRVRALALASGIVVKGPGPAVTSCYEVTTANARAIAAVLRSARHEREESDAGLRFTVAGRSPLGLRTTIDLLPILPHGEVCGCR
jgi:hypothetical protein